MFTRFTNLEGILHALWIQTRNTPYCRFAAKVAYSNTENKGLHRWYNMCDRFAVHASEEQELVLLWERNWFAKPAAATAVRTRFVAGKWGGCANLYGFFQCYSPGTISHRSCSSPMYYVQFTHCDWAREVVVLKFWCYDIKVAITLIL
jgi:hypothetical protein